MKKIARNELLPYKEYVQVHEKFLQRVIAEKKIRRFTLNERMSGLFETRLTVWYQIQEMIRAEEIEREEYLEDMLSVYNDLLPDDNELSLTLFIEIPNQEQLRAFNKTIIGIENSVELRFGDTVITSYEPDSEEEADENYTQSVHYLRLPFTAEQLSSFKAYEGDVIATVNHANYQSTTTLSPELVASLKKELES
ncbi:DUF3501 family protein [Aneurinibacillus sp. Ricciae_BoGa-3]|uniref:DUF3501 family protein n=1 Tax=Aneurinibacillus sp. Ricciae_BoGa-3 TaxID=3022697 RepID=UPI00233FB667|nr:DUF3501 family protein [Aneurinibacillus sp. Ricciae_BoGa-3]WCK54942.1 DUF3501 family protein [Aneurinibacillus sp. Ricciae_BoGa-3]